jgi:hypothetical protein
MSVYRISQLRPWTGIIVFILAAVLAFRGWWIGGILLFASYNLAMFVLLRCPRCYWWLFLSKLFRGRPSDYWVPRACPRCGLDLTAHRPFGPPRPV